MSSVLRDVFFTASEHDVWREIGIHGLSDIASVTKGGRVFANGQLMFAVTLLDSNN